MSPEQIEKMRQHLIAQYAEIRPIHLNDSLPQGVYQRQLIAFHTGLFHGLVSLAKTEEDFEQVQQQLNIIKSLLPYYDQKRPVEV
ncbi:hypothetical protein [Sulfobacillus thermosulfidooxidans]|uniref:Uncharacterized protein n=2 Tax=Sulfobacillus thermosulfidooxidans TaxID=28034 RepID=A0A1W1WFQ8_SULTA|nr:hypothetical protein [Sulfobacillus thermosulfidooxidans]OLZ08356.1 hypothetical protein BFX05_03760 [Sulfobacillus thermosulfidooxidans]OLZ13922.1 hypothetical protein BFX06_06315 [Sulfobacillus thermosulfidooxidans]OLZ20540.1 hypothetical protein BFX07_15110 [Sulfobacillus thermosulfidooxidans]PSR26395.1 MAG: hypothetical protein C7B47_10900 [Sulfobacillus thermosulfidooxidans]SMC05032.1 hypothetical protein SAMN00768000_1986 [Sulfobacillus thermosulfidooxidans DSM 9293]